MTTKLIHTIEAKKIVFVSTKNIDYIRNTQEIELICKYSDSCQIVAFSTKNYFLRVMRVYIKLIAVLLKKDYDVLFLGFSPQLLFLLLPFISKKKTVVMDFFISVYDTLIDDRKKFKPNSLFAKLFHSLDTYVIHKANLVVADTKAHKKYFSEEFLFPLDNIEVLYIEADTSIYQNQLLPTHTKSATNELKVIYFGTILPVQGIETILEAIKFLKENSSITFTIVGPLVKKYNIHLEDYPNATFIDWLPQEQLANKIAESDLALAGHFSLTVGKANRTIAGKTYIYKAMNKPVILGDSDANRELFEEDGKTNFYIERGNPKALADLISDIQKRKRLGH